MTQKQLALVSGAGQGLGQALLRKFEVEGLHAVGLVRTPVTEETGLDVRTCDVSDADVTGKVIGGLIQEFGPPKIVVHNPAHLVIQPFMETTQEEFEACWRSMVQSAVILGQAVLQSMVRGGGGAFIVSGATASLRGGAKFGAFASAKFALRGLTQSLAREFQPAGIHVVHTILDGIIDTNRSRDLHSLDPSKMMKPEDIADVYWYLANQPKSTWSHEVDLRPQTEGF